MSDYYPNGYYPSSTTTPPMWNTAAAAGASIVQLNGLVYTKNDRHTGGTGRPDEEVDDDGFRTWSLYGGNSLAPGFKFNFVFLDNQISKTVEMDDDTYSSTSNYFNDGAFGGIKASINVSTEDCDINDVAAVLPLPQSELTTRSAQGPFIVYEPQHNPGVRTVPASDGYNGYQSDVPGMPPRTPPTLAPIEITLQDYISFNHFWFVGRTYSGYLEVLTSTGSWVANGAGSYDYVVQPATVTQIGITLQATAANYELYLQGLPQVGNIVTHSITGAEDTWVEFGTVVLASVSPGATN
jgi:hypothetical protein